MQAEGWGTDRSTKTSAYTWDTDGSKIDKDNGIGIERPGRHGNFSVGLGTEPTILQTKLFAIITFAQIFLGKHTSGRNIN